jgi:hypothetical protein
MKRLLATAAMLAAIMPTSLYASEASKEIMPYVAAARDFINNPGWSQPSYADRMAVVRGFAVVDWYTDMAGILCGMPKNKAAISAYESSLGETAVEKERADIYVTSILVHPDPDFCSKAYSFFGPDGTMIPNLIKKGAGLGAWAPSSPCTMKTLDGKCASDNE